MHRSRGEQPVYGAGFQSFDLDPFQQFFSNGFDRPGGQGGPAQLAVGVGQGGLDGMQAVEPFTPAFASAGRLSGRPARLFCGFSGRFGVKMTTILAEILGCHAALIKKWGRR